MAPSGRSVAFEAMGTAVELHALADQLAQALATVQQVFRSWDGALSRFRRESELTALNRAAGRPFVASELLLRVVLRAMAWARLTDGTFDPALLNQIERLPTARQAMAHRSLPSLAAEQGRGANFQVSPL